MSHFPYYKSNNVCKPSSKLCLSKFYSPKLQHRSQHNDSKLKLISQQIKSVIYPTVFIASFFYLITNQSAFAKTADSDSNFSQANRAEQMTIFATGNERDTFTLPMQVSVIENNPNQPSNINANDLLRLQTGIQLSGTERANGQTINMRGYDKRGVLVQIDGIKQGTDTGHIDGTFLDSSLIKRVEIVKGANALLYGSGALGGVIAYQTIDARDLLREGENVGMLHFLQGATGDNSIGSGAALYGKTEHLDGLIAGALRERGNLKQALFDSPNDETIGNLLAKANWYIDDAQRLTAQIRYYHNQAKQPKDAQQNPQSDGSISDIDLLNDSLVDRTTRQRNVQLNYALKPQGQNWLDLNLLTYEQNIQIDQQGNDTNTNQGNASTNTTKETREQITRGIKIENRSNYNPEFLTAHQLTYGAEYSRQDQRPNDTVKNVFPDAKIDFKSLWLQDELTLLDLPAALILGSRYDDYHAKNSQYEDVKADRWSHRAGLSITPTEWLMLFTSYSEAFRAPSLGELYNDSKHFAIGPFYTNNWVPNPNLKPETNHSMEYGFGLRFSNLLLDNDDFSLKTSYFDTRAKDYISTSVDMNFSNPPVGFPPNFPFGQGTTTSINIPRATITGWDAQMQYATDYFDWVMNFSAIRGKNDQTGEWIDAIQPNTLSTRITVPIADTGLNLAWQGRFVDAATRVKSTTKPQAGYGVNDVYLTYENQDILPNIALSVGMENALNKSYFSPQGIPQSKRSAQFKASYRF